jgi:hypothetical protein
LQYASALTDLSTMPAIGGYGPGWAGWRFSGAIDETMLGPFWASFNVAVMVSTMGFLWPALFNQPVSRYI